MTPEELQAEADRIAALRNDPRTPAVVRRAFVRRGGVSLRGYLALEEAGSPVLSGAWPVEDAGQMAEAFCAGWGIVFPERAVPPASELAQAIGEMAAEVSRGFSTVMPMRFPRTPGATPVHEPHDGLGWVARLLGRFVALGWKPDDVLDLPLDQLFVLNAALQANEGADSAGEDYRERKPESGKRKAETGDRKGSAVIPGFEEAMSDVGVAQAGDEANDSEEKEHAADNVKHKEPIA
jgi:hypothetical protein